MQEVEIRLVDDIDRKTTAAETMAFTFDGVAYEVDLSKKHASEFRRAVAPYVKVARPATKKRRGTTSKRRKPVPQPKPEAKVSSVTEARAEQHRIREWAREQGIEVPATGRVRRDVREAYAQAQAVGS